VGKIKAKRNKIANKPKSNKTKFIIIGIIATIVVAGLLASLLGNNSISNANQNSRLLLDTTKGSPVLGSESAPVTIVEFGDYQCPFCRKWNVETKPALEENYINTGKAKLIYVDFPIIGPDSIKAHAGSYCAAEQGFYWQYHDFVYKNQGHENDGWANSNNIKSLVSKLNGVDIQTFSQCIDSGKYENRVLENRNIASKSGAKSTPSFIIIGPDGTATPVTGAQPYSVFQRVIDEKL
jgi:protein-disulfide isomerase